MTTNLLCRLGRPGKFTKPKRVDMTGQVVNDLRVLEFVNSMGHCARWRCQCVNCGALKITTRQELRRGAVRCQVCKKAAPSKSDTHGAK